MKQIRTLQVEVISNAHIVSYLEPRTQIEEPQSSQGNVCYLILGEERAVMFDTGAGENTIEAGMRRGRTNYGFAGDLVHVPLSF